MVITVHDTENAYFTLSLKNSGFAAGNLRGFPPFFPRGDGWGLSHAGLPPHHPSFQRDIYRLQSASRQLQANVTLS